MNRKELLEEIKKIQDEIDLELHKNGAFGYKKVIMEDLIKGFFSPKFIGFYNNIINNSDEDFSYFLSPRLLKYYKKALKGILENIKRYDLSTKYDKEALKYLGGDQGRYQKEAYKEEFNSSTSNDFKKYNNSKLDQIVSNKKPEIEALDASKQKEYKEYLEKVIKKDIVKFNSSNYEDVISLLDGEMILPAQVLFLKISYDYIKVFNNYNLYIKKVEEVKNVVIRQYNKKAKRKKVKEVHSYPCDKNGQLGFEGFEGNGKKRKN